jgi:CDP-glycerol glycerophosphotransferase
MSQQYSLVARNDRGDVPGQPLISVIIPVHDVEPYLGECLDSVLGQSFGDIEVIAVESDSADKSGAILDDHARADPRLRARHVPGHGPGRARNVALGEATGRYVWFVDADDLIPPGSLQAITEAIGNEPCDVLLFDYACLYPGGQTKARPGRDLLPGAPAGSFSLAGWPDAISLTATVWSKVFRRGFLLDSGISFPDGIHEDVPVSFGALLGAAKIRVLSRVCYLYRQRPGSFMATASERHFDIFRSYRQVLDMAAKWQPNDDAGSVDKVRTALFVRAIGHYATTLEGGRRVPRGDRRRYFAMMREDFVAYRPAGYRPPEGLSGLKYRLIARNAYLLYSAATRVNRGRLRVQARARGARPSA